MSDFMKQRFEGELHATVTETSQVGHTHLWQPTAQLRYVPRVAEREQVSPNVYRVSFMPMLQQVVVCSVCGLSEWRDVPVEDR